MYRSIFRRYNALPMPENATELDRVKKFIESLKGGNTARTAYFALKSAFTVQGWPWFPEDADPLPPLPEEVERPFYTKEEIDAIFNEARRDNPRDYLLVRITFLSGARRIQVVKIRKQDYDPRRGVLQIAAAKNTPAGEWLLDPVTREVLELYLKNHKWYYLFPSRNGKGHLSPDTLTEVWRKYCERAGIVYRQEGMKHGKGAHGARRGRVTYLHKIGYDLDDITKALRWKGPQTVMTYIRTLPSEVMEDIQKHDPYYMQ
jgi:integrase